MTGNCLFVGYRKLGGVTFEDESITREQLAALAPALVTFLSELHSFPVAQAVQAGVQEHTPEQWRERYQERVFPLLDAALRKESERLWEDFLDINSLLGQEGKGQLTVCEQ
jgi:phosphotransferase family enzyme